MEIIIKCTVLNAAKLELLNWRIKYLVWPEAG
jgi:hypothetical protein